MENRLPLLDATDRVFIAGRWRSGASSETLPLINPSDGSTLAAIARGTAADIDAAVTICREAGNDKIALLRCVSSYPAKPESMALSSFDVLRGFETVVGLSDHTREATVAIASVALGAKLIEKAPLPEDLVTH